MQNMSVTGGGELPQANGNLGGHAHATEGTTLLFLLGSITSGFANLRWRQGAISIPSYQ
jgi:hypothetical protein